MKATATVAAEPLPPARVPPVDATVPSFRDRAIAAQLRGESPAALLAVAPPSAWGALAALGSVVLAGALLALFGHVEVTARGSGALLAPGGVLPIVAEVGGVVAEVRVRSGDRVRAGQVLARLDAAAMQAALLEAERQLAFVDRRAAASASRRQALGLERKRLLEQRIELTQLRIAGQQDSVAHLDRRHQDLAILESQGYLGRHQLEDQDEERATAVRQLLGLDQDLADSQAQLAALASDRESETITVAQEREQAQARRDAAALVLRQASIAAPRDGVIEAVLVHPGEVLAAGAAVGRLVPLGTPTELVAFIDEKDRAFLRPGAKVRIELEQLPVSEFGALGGTVRRIGEDLASASDVRDVLGEAATTGRAQYRVDIALGPTRAVLRPGMLASVRYTLRRRRLIALVFRAFEEELQ